MFIKLEYPHVCKVPHAAKAQECLESKWDVIVNKLKIQEIFVREHRWRICHYSQFLEPWQRLII